MLEGSETANFLLRWYQEMLTGLVVIISGLLLKARGQKDPKYLTEAHIDNKLTICRQSVMLDMQKALDARDEKLLDHIREIIAK